MPRHCLRPAWLVLAVLIPMPAATAAEPANKDPLIESRLPEFVALYEHLHRHPELSYREVNTARRIAEELQDRRLRGHHRSRARWGWSA